VIVELTFDTSQCRLSKAYHDQDASMYHSLVRASSPASSVVV